MRFIKYFLVLLLVACSTLGSRAQLLPQVTPPVLPPGVPQNPPSVPPASQNLIQSPDTILKQYGDSEHIMMMAKNYEGALRYANLRIRKTPFRMQFMYYDRATAEAYLGMNPNAIRDYDTVIGLDSSAAAAYMNQAYLYMQEHKTDKALLDYEKGLKVSKDSAIIADIHLSRANAYLSLKQTKEAEADFTMALTYNPHSWQAWLQRGATRRFAKNYKEALHDLNMAYKLKPTDPDVLQLRGMVLYESGMYKEAIPDLIEANNFHKNDVNSLFYLGMAEMKTGDDSLAKEYFTKILEQNPKNVFVLNTLGKINFEMKHPLLAIKDYTKVIQIKPKSPEGYANRAYVYSQIGERDKSCADWHKAASLGMTKANDIIKKYCGK